MTHNTILFHHRAKRGTKLRAPAAPEVLVLLKFFSEKCSDICCEKYRQLDSSTVQRLQTRDDFYELSKILFLNIYFSGVD